MQEEDKVRLAAMTGLDPKQINNWFINQRKRHWKPSEDMRFALMEGVTGGGSSPELALLLRSLAAARRVASHLASSSPSSPSTSTSFAPTFLFNRAIESLAACGSLADAREMFDAMPRRDGGSWNAITSASSRAGHPAEMFSLFADMNSLGIRPKDVTLASVLDCCAECLDMRGAQQLHGHIAKRDFQSNVIRHGTG